MEADNEIKKVLIVGRGAVGGLFGSLIEAKIHDNFAFLCDEERKKRYLSHPYFVNGIEKKYTYISDEPFLADLVLITTKESGFAQAMEQIKGHLKDDTILISGLNGISSDELLMNAFDQPVIRAISQKMDATYQKEHLNYSQTGELVIGMESEDQRLAFARLKNFLDAIDFPYVESEDIVHDQYSKLMLNCALNQICGLYHATYGDILKEPYLKALFIETMKEVQSVLAAYGIEIMEEELEGWVDAVGRLDPNSMPSLAQDMRAGRKTEVELFSGTLLPLAKEKKIDTPHLEAFYAQIKAYEAHRK